MRIENNMTTSSIRRGFIIVALAAVPNNGSCEEQKPPAMPVRLSGFSFKKPPMLE